MKLSIALIGDYNEEITAHKAIPLSIDLASKSLGFDSTIKWISTPDCQTQDLKEFDAIWCVPASPYESMTGALNAIQYARESKTPFLGTCGGYQHAVLEFTRNVLGYENADNAEVNPDTNMPLISALSCKLIEKTDAINICPNSKVSEIHQSENIEEEYQCSFGVNSKYLLIYKNTDLRFTGFDENKEPRVFEIENHPFFVGTAYQPERSAFKNKTHPMIVSFLKAAYSKYLLSK